MDELETQVVLPGLDVVDIGAGGDRFAQPLDDRSVGVALCAWLEFDTGFPPKGTDLDTAPWSGIPVRWMKLHDSTHVVDCGDPTVLAAILGRI